MTTTSSTLTFASLPKTYLGLVSHYVPRPIHDRTSYDNALEIVQVLAGHKLNRDQDDYLTILAILIGDYERETLPPPKPVPGIETLRFLLNEHDLSAEDLGKIIEVDRSIAYRILKGARKLTAGHIKKLSARLGVSADLLLA